MGKGERPEHQAPPEIFYNEDEARKYTSNTRMIAIQEKLTERAVELLALPQDGVPKLLLDLGCGSGLSSQALTDLGHQWIGFDISPAMLDVALEREVDGDVGLLDMGHGVPLRPGTCDGAISISAVQWLCNADKTGHDPRKRLKRFFETLYACLARGARAVLQVYPANDTQAEMMVTAAMRVGFSGGLVVDFPHSTRARKCFLVLMVGQSTATLPHARGLDGSEPMDEDEEGVEQGEVKVAGRQRSHHTRRGGKGGKDKRGAGKGREWVLKKKEQTRKKGVGLVKPDTKYTARKRRHLT